MLVNPCEDAIVLLLSHGGMIIIASAIEIVECLAGWLIGIITSTTNINLKLKLKLIIITIIIIIITSIIISICIIINLSFALCGRS